MEQLQIPFRALSETDLKKDEKTPLTSYRSGSVYQPLQLNKRMTNRHIENKTIEALDIAEGLSPINPDTDFKPSFLRNMISKDNSITCEFLIVVAMYNESSEHFTNTISGITDNLDVFEAAGVSHEKIACVVIVDGMKAFLDTYKKQPLFFSQFFKEDCVKDRFQVEDMMNCKLENEKESDEFAHCFMHEVILGKSEIPLKMVFCVKQKNKRKLNTHLWFFGGFCEMIKPKFVMLLDVGTKPYPRSLFYLYEAMNCNSQLAGCCGEIKPMNYSIWKIVVPAQFVEYKFAHMLDKALESVIGYITVLPGAFSAYRWEALTGSPLWDDYFKSICHPELMDTFQSNIYLAEDRVLCLSLVTKKYEKYTLRYVRSSVAETDVPETLSDLMAQRRRWINGSWFALVDSVIKFTKVFRSRHHWIRKIFFSLQMLYYCLNVIYTWFIVGLYCLAFTITIFKNFDGQDFEIVGTILIIIYVTLLLIVFIASLGVKPKRVEDFFKALALIMGAYQIYIIYLTSKFMIYMNYSRFSRQIIIGAGGLAGFFALIVMVNCEIISVLKGVLHYVFLIPTYVNIFFIYSICNVHDCTWGNRPDKLTPEELERIEEFEEFRTRWAIFWVLCNSGIAYLAFWIYKQDNQVSFSMIAGITITGISIIILRGVGGLVYLITESFQEKMTINEKKLEEDEKNRKINKVTPSYAKESRHSLNFTSFIPGHKNEERSGNIQTAKNEADNGVKENESKSSGRESERERKEKLKEKEEKKKKREEKIKRREEKKKMSEEKIKKREEKIRRKEEKKKNRDKGNYSKTGGQFEEIKSTMISFPVIDDDKASKKHGFEYLDKISEDIKKDL